MEPASTIPHYRGIKRALIAAVAMLIMLIVGISFWKADAEYRLTVRSAELQTKGYARALKEHAERALSEADTALLDTLEHIEEHGGLEAQSGVELKKIITTHTRTSPQIGSIVLVNSTGMLFAHSLDAPTKNADVADREYFLHHRDHPGDDAPFLSRPIKSRINGKWRFTLSRPVRSKAGVFEGLVAVAFDMDYFQDFYKSLEMGNNGRIVIMRKDGALLLAQPFDEKILSIDFSKSPLVTERLPSAPSGTYHAAVGKAPVDNAARIVSFDSLSRFPVVVAADMATDEVTASWRHNRLIHSLLALALSCALMLFLLMLLRQIKDIKRSYQRQLEQQAEISFANERYRMLVENLPVVIWQTDETGLVRYISNGVTRVDGFTPEEIYAGGSDQMQSRIHPDDVDRVMAAFRALFVEGTVFDVEFRIRHREGHWIWLHDFAYTTALLDGVRIAHGIFSDITARKQAEDERAQLEMQLRQAQKMEAIGHLAGGIAHDFNNLLTPIMGYAEMITARLPAGDPMESKLAGITAAAHKAKDLTRQLLNFGRRQSNSTEVIDLNEVILSFNAILRRTIRESIRIDLILDPDGAFIRADKSQMEQIILNMTVNAQDAFGDKQGRINIETCKVRMDGENARMHPGMIPGDYVLLSFRDNGCGISSEVMNHIFEPFFTTKQTGHGTGLGLATVYGIVKQHDAHISVTSRVDAGTSFMIYFPCCPLEPDVGLAVEEPPQGRNLGDATILVVEDNEVVREMVCEMLGGIGYTLLSAADPHKAVELLEKDDVRIDLLVSDVVMPGMSGPELYERLIVKTPDLKAVYISGYPINPSLRGGTLEDQVSYLQKPFTAEALLERVRQVL